MHNPGGSILIAPHEHCKDQLRVLGSWLCVARGHPERSFWLLKLHCWMSSYSVLAGPPRWRGREISVLKISRANPAWSRDGAIDFVF